MSDIVGHGVVLDYCGHRHVSRVLAVVGAYLHLAPYEPPPCSAALAGIVQDAGCRPAE